MRKIAEWSLEVNPPPPRQEDMIVKLLLEPMELVLARPVLQRIVDFILVPLAGPARQHPPASDALVLVPRLERPLLLDLRVDLEAPTIILPTSYESEAAPALILPLHLITVCTDYSLPPPPELQRAVRDPPPELAEPYFYRRFTIKATKLQAVAAPRDTDAWRRLVAEEKATVFENQNVALSLSIRTEPSLQLPLVKLAGQVPAASLRLSDAQLAALLLAMDEVTDAFPRNLPFVPPPAPRKPINEKMMELSLAFADARATLYRAADGRELLSLRVAELTAAVDLLEHANHVRLRAGQLCAVARLQPHGEAHATLAALTPQAGVADPFLMRYTGTAPNSPLFAGVEHDISASLSLSESLSRLSCQSLSPS